MRKQLEEEDKDILHHFPKNNENILWEWILYYDDFD